MPNGTRSQSLSCTDILGFAGLDLSRRVSSCCCAPLELIAGIGAIAAVPKCYCACRTLPGSPCIARRLAAGDQGARVRCASHGWVVRLRLDRNGMGQRCGALASGRSGCSGSARRAVRDGADGRRRRAPRGRRHDRRHAAEPRDARADVRWARRYDVIVFHEGRSDALRPRLEALGNRTRLRLRARDISDVFATHAPASTDWPRRRLRTFGIGYRRMCRFWFSGVFELADVRRLHI